MKNKQKTKKAISKRIRLTANNNIKRKKAFMSHLALSKSQKQKRHARKSTLLGASDRKRWGNFVK